MRIDLLHAFVLRFACLSDSEVRQVRYTYCSNCFFKAERLRETFSVCVKYALVDYEAPYLCFESMSG